MPVIRVHDALELELKKIQQKLKEDISRKYNVEVELGGNPASQIAARILQGKSEIQFEIEKKGLNKGRIKIL